MAAMIEPESQNKALGANSPDRVIIAGFG